MWSEWGKRVWNKNNKARIGLFDVSGSFLTPGPVVFSSSVSASWFIDVYGLFYMIWLNIRSESRDTCCDLFICEALWGKCPHSPSELMDHSDGLYQNWHCGLLHHVSGIKAEHEKTFHFEFLTDGTKNKQQILKILLIQKVTPCDHSNGWTL